MKKSDFIAEFHKSASKAGYKVEDPQRHGQFDGFRIEKDGQIFFVAISIPRDKSPLVPSVFEADEEEKEDDYSSPPAAAPDVEEPSPAEASDTGTTGSDKLHFYIAGNLDNVRNQQLVKDGLEELGHYCTYDWADSLIAHDDDPSEDALRKESQKQIMATVTADVVVILLPAREPSVHVTLGVALNSGAKTFVVDPTGGSLKDCPAYWQDGVYRVSVPYNEAAQMIHNHCLDKNEADKEVEAEVLAGV